MIPKKIYFAGSIRGGRDLAELYHRLIDHMKRRHTVLTEHVGSSNLCLTEQGRQLDKRIYDQDTSWLKECDIVVAECTVASLGVGYELAFAEQLGKPVHIFYNTTRCHLSAMLTGDPYFNIYPYENEDDVIAVLDKILSK